MIAEELAADGVPFEYLDAWESPEVPDLRGHSGVAVLGGDMNVDELDRYPWLRTVRDVTARTLDAGLPYLGICLGAQTLARVCGAAVAPSPVREVGFVQLTPTSEGRADPVAAPFAATPVFQWHEDAFELPAGAAPLLTGAEVAHQAFRVGDNAYAVQFHFEVSAEMLARWCDDSDPDELERVWGVTKESLLEAARPHLPGQRAAAETATRAFAALLAASGR
ncbi:MAG TPA: type 1 glutamine amidotransferase [Actinomycetota bacterium]|nr:type 1 glutamine amidotransferase [Actinomycetota bacterium]